MPGDLAQGSGAGCVAACMSLARRVPLLAASVTAFAVLAAPASAATTTPRVLPTAERTVSAADAQKRDCRTEASGARGVATRSWTAPDDGFVAARLHGANGSDWDLALFDAATGRKLDASLAFRSNELAVTQVVRGQKLMIQSCRRAGRDAAVPLTIDFTALLVEPVKHKLQLVEIEATTREDFRRIHELGIDTTDHTDGIDQHAVLHGPDDARKLTEAGFEYRVEIDDLVKHDAEERAAERRAARTGVQSNLPSGRETYRTYDDYLADLKAMVDENPGLVRPVTLPVKTLDGRDITGVEIATGVDRTDDGRPVYVQIGVHHAREWPAGEAAIEFGLDLLKRGKAGEPRWRNVLDNVRTFVVPIMNVDGFITSRTPGYFPTDDNAATPGTPQHIIGGAAYRRKNCRPFEPLETGVPCVARQQNDNGVDPNRNYGEKWGGPGTSSDQTSLVYHGTGPFSEPETQSVRQWLLGLQPTVLITNHTFTGLILRPPGTSDDGLAPDELRMRQLGDAMARETQYVSQYSFQLYDTSGTTDDWLYGGLASFSFTPEIGKVNFHPNYVDEFVPEYDGREGLDKDTGEFEKLGGLREAFLLAGETAIDQTSHAILTGTAPAGRTLRIQRDFETVTSARPNDDGVQHDVQRLPEHREVTMTVPASGEYTWHVAPSTRPFEPNPIPWTISCEDGAGQVLEKGEIFVARNQKLTVDLCAAPVRGRDGEVIGVCSDRFRPQSTFARSSQVTRRRLALSGRSVDRGCIDPVTKRIKAEGVGVVQVAVLRFLGDGRCQSVMANGRLSRPRSCRQPATYLRAQGTLEWRLDKRVRLPRGVYKLWVRGIDRAGNHERRDARRNFLRKRVR
jgi:Zinc carboxypeptidase